MKQDKNITAKELIRALRSLPPDTIVPTKITRAWVTANTPEDHRGGSLPGPQKKSLDKFTKYAEEHGHLPYRAADERMTVHWLVFKKKHKDDSRVKELIDKYEEATNRKKEADRKQVRKGRGYDRWKQFIEEHRRLPTSLDGKELFLQWDYFRHTYMRDPEIRLWLKQYRKATEEYRIRIRQGGTFIERYQHWMDYAIEHGHLPVRYDDMEEASQWAKFRTKFRKEKCVQELIRDYDVATRLHERHLKEQANNEKETAI